MADSEKAIIERFYKAFQNRDYKTMQELYHPEATFHDPAFQTLDSGEVKAMWQMLITSAKDLRISYHHIQAHPSTGSCEWEAFYTFGKNRKVHNRIKASFQFRDGLILNHNDEFNVWSWSRQALGLPGLLLGWSPIIQNRIRESAGNRLKKFLQENPSS